MSIDYQAGASASRQTGWGILIAAALTAYGIRAKRRQQEAGGGQAAGGRVGDGRGRRASSPGQIPARGWWDILMRVKDDISCNNLSLIAAGVAFYAFLAIPSALTALVSLYGLVFNPDDVQRQLQGLQGVLPGEGATVIADQLKNISSGSGSKLGVGLVFSLLVALWSTRSGTSSLITALDIAYGEQEKRGFIRFQAIALGLTLGAVLFAVVALALVAVLPAIIDLLPLGRFGRTVAEIVRWPLLVVLMMVALAALYRFAPSREEPKWRWVSWGAVIATLLWIAGSALFSVYVREFASYDKTYGSLGAVVVLLIWLYLTCFAVLLGAQINAEIERQTAHDSTTGRQKPMGARGARAADTIGPAR
jgi:membrane protein